MAICIVCHGNCSSAVITTAGVCPRCERDLRSEGLDPMSPPWGYYLEHQRPVLDELLQEASRVADEECSLTYIGGGGVLLSVKDATAESRLVASIDKALALAPNDPDILFAKSEALEAGMQGESAQQIRRRALAIAPEHFDARMREEHYQEWSNLFTNPGWSEDMQKVPEVMLGWQQDGVPMQIIRDGLKLTLAILQPASREHFPSHIPGFRWKPLWVETPDGPLFAHYVMLDLGGGRINRDELLLSPYPVTPVGSRNGDWLVRRACNVESLFLVYNDGEDVLFNKRFIFKKPLRRPLRSIAEQHQKLPYTPDHLERFQNAAKWYMQNSSPDDIEF